MRVKAKRLVGIAAVVGVVALVAAFLAGWRLATAYHDPEWSKLMNLTEAANFAEFWLNRYQTLLTGAAALFAAWYASLPARHQLQEMARQSAAATRPAAVEIARALEAESNHLQKGLQLQNEIEHLLVHDDRDFDLCDIYFMDAPRWHKQCSSLVTNLKGWHKTLCPIALRSPDDGPLNLSRAALINRTLDLANSLEALKKAFLTDQYDDVEAWELRGITRGPELAADKALGLWSSVLEEACKHVSADIKSTWKFIADLERTAFGSRG